MKAQDIQDNNNNRGEAIRLLSEFCDNLHLSYSYTEKSFRIKLPDIEDVPVLPISTTKRKTFNTDGWPTANIDETLPTEFPLAEKPLDEGETPKGDDEK